MSCFRSSNSKLKLFLLLAILLFARPSYAEQSNDDRLVLDGSRDIAEFEKEKLHQLAKHPTWLKLLYYQKNIFSSGYSSEAGDPDFFLADNGVDNPLAELQASVSALKIPQTISKADEHFYCEFPARSEWLMNRLPELELKASDFICPEFDVYRNEINASGVTLIFPAAYLDSPSSMFGHTFFRFDKKGQDEKSEILAYSINYAANKREEDSELEFMLGGLLGGYPGTTTIIPYYMKLREYRNIESRDVWEYTLNLDQQETDFLVKHVYEIRDRNFDYSFLSRNCSYRLLTMLDVVREDSKLAEQFPVYAIPVDTIRAMINDGWVVDHRYRPSVMSNMRFYLDSLKADEKRLVIQLVEDPENSESLLAAFPEKDRTRLLEIAYRYSRVKTDNSGEAKQTSYTLLLERNKREAGGAISDKPEPEFRDDEGHYSARTQLLYGEANEQSFVQGQMRFAYHDLTDPALGYPGGASLKFLDFKYRYYEDDKLQGELLDIVSIKSLKPRSQFFNPVSWSVALGAKRNFTDTDREFMPYGQAEMGLVYGNPDFYTYFMTGAELLIDSGLQKGFEFYSSTNVGTVLRPGPFQMNLEYEWREPMVGTLESDQKLELIFQYNISRTLTFNLDASRNEFSDFYWSDVAVGLNYFF